MKYKNIESVFIGEFSCIEDVINNFDLKLKDVEGAHILLAMYNVEYYDGEAFVLFERDGKLYEVHGAHCSCFGLEGQWCPEETSTVAMEFRYKNKQQKKELLHLIEALKREDENS